LTTLPSQRTKQGKKLGVIAVAEEVAAAAPGGVVGLVAEVAVAEAVEEVGVSRRLWQN